MGNIPVYSGFLLIRNLRSNNMFSQNGFMLNKYRKKIVQFHLKPKSNIKKPITLT